LAQANLARVVLSLALGEARGGAEHAAAGRV